MFFLFFSASSCNFSADLSTTLLAILLRFRDGGLPACVMASLPPPEIALGLQIIQSTPDPAAHSPQPPNNFLISAGLGQFSLSEQRDLGVGSVSFATYTFKLYSATHHDLPDHTAKSRR